MQWERERTHEVLHLLGGTWINVKPIKTHYGSSGMFYRAFRCSYGGQGCPFSGFDPLVAGGTSPLQDLVEGPHVSHMLCRSWWRAILPLHAAVAACCNWRSKEGKELYTEAKKIYQSRRPICPLLRAVWSKRMTRDGDKKQLFLCKDKVRPLRFWTCDRRVAFSNSDVNSPHVLMHFRRLHWSSWSLKGSIKAKKKIKLPHRPMRQLFYARCSDLAGQIHFSLHLIKLFHVRCGKWPNPYALQQDGGIS